MSKLLQLILVTGVSCSLTSVSFSQTLISEKAPRLTVRAETETVTDQSSQLSPVMRDGSDARTSSDSVTTVWIRHYVSGLGPAQDEVSDVAVDISGNVYVTGSSNNVPFGLDYLTIKYDPSGNEIWRVYYDGDHGEDIPIALVVDDSGNTYVTGYSDVSSDDYATIKYDASGIMLWVARYDGPGNSSDRASAIALDATGNVYVTGSSRGSGSFEDYATVKYDASGTMQWVARYNGTGNFFDGAVALAVDASGNVYVTGTSPPSSTSFDYATVKYDAAGTELWVSRYNGPANSWDMATDLALDSWGNVYVTGSSSSPFGSDHDYVTIKYSTSGTELWVARYNGPGNNVDQANALGVDGSGNVYVTGGSSLDCATIKYDSSGVEQWVARYNGPGNAWDEAHDLAFDGSGNIYVSGPSYGSGTSIDYVTIKYNPSGSELWAARYDGPVSGHDESMALALDGAGNVFVTGNSRGLGNSDDDYVTIKYDTAGTEQWSARYNGSGESYDYASDLTVDGSGNVYITGYSEGANNNEDYATIKYDPTGAEQWLARYDGPGAGDDNAQALEVDASGNVYVTGSSHGSGTGQDYATVKYNAAGTELWAARYNGPGNGLDLPRNLAVDASGNVYVTGLSAGMVAGFDFATAKYNSSGVEEWVIRYNGPANAWDEARAIAVDASGNVYVTGLSTGSGTEYDYATIKYNSSGVEQWVARYNGPGNALDEAFALALDAAGNVYVTGSSVGTGTLLDYATIMYSGAGVEQWVARYNGPADREDQAIDIAVGPLGNIYVTGISYGTGTFTDYLTISYTPLGVERWVARFNGTGGGDDRPGALIVDGGENVFVTGTSRGQSSSQDDYATIKYDAAGSEKWVVRYDGLRDSDHQAVAVDIDPWGNVLVTGSSSVDDWSIYTTVKYEQHPVSVDEPGGVLVETISLSHNYPNPFNPMTNIDFRTPNSGFVSLKVFDVLGREVATLVNKEMNPGSHKATWDATGMASGVYLYRLKAGEFTETKKLMLMR